MLVLNCVQMAWIVEKRCRLHRSMFIFTLATFQEKFQFKSPLNHSQTACFGYFDILPLVENVHFGLTGDSSDELSYLFPPSTSCSHTFCTLMPRSKRSKDIKSKDFMEDNLCNEGSLKRGQKYCAKIDQLQRH